ncbi:MAG TPA: DedA family protein [Myxococcaceae bacterium]|nr:DedA family protein [Myxococcaceae bacterium]
MLEAFDSAIRQVGPAAFFVLGLAAFLEYLLPPFPGDSVVLLGGIYAVRGQQPYWLVFAAVIAGSLLGAAANFRMGQWVGARVERNPERKTILGISMRSLHDAEARMRKYGDWLIAANRFIPGIRGLFFVAAGMSGMKRARVLALGAVSATAHTLLLLYSGIALGGNAERIAAFMGQWQRATGWLVAAVAVVAVPALLIRWLSKRKKNGVATP